MEILRKSKMPSLWVQLADLFLIELTNWRWSWRLAVLNGIITPMLGIIALGIFAQGRGEETLAYILTGNVILSLLFGNLDRVQSHFIFMRINGSLDYFASLPIYRYMLVVAALFSFLLLSLPSILITILFGTWFLSVPLVFNPLIFLVVPLCALPLAGLGAVIGTVVSKPEEAGSISLLLTLIMTALGPIVVPPARLPALLVDLGYVNPAAYAASAFRQTLLGPMTPTIFVDLIVLIGCSLLSFWLAGHKMKWRQN